MKHFFFVFYLFQTHSGCRSVFQMTAVDTFLVGYHFTTNLQHAISPLGGDYRLAIPLITPISQSWSESTQVLTCCSVVEIDLESPK